MESIFVGFLAAFIYFIPSIVGFFRGHTALGGLIMLNICLGWSIIGWVGSLIWGCVGKTDGY